MRSASHQPSASPHDASLRRRGLALALTIAAHVLLILMLLRLAPPPFLRKPEPRLITIALPPEAPETPTRAKTRVKRSGGGAPPRVRPAPTPPAASAAAPTPPLEMMVVTRDVFAAADIGRLPKHQGAPAAQSADAGGGAGAGSGDAEGVGTGPGGEHLYNAEWYRRPTDAELAFYMPKGKPHSGAGLIACRTVADYRVEDCVELGESPAGSGLARAVRQAAWQFRVLPPRLGGRPLVGAWVRIRIDYSERETK